MNKSIKLLFNYLLAPVLFAVLVWSLYRQLVVQPDLELRWQQIKLSWLHPLFWLTLLLMVINYGLEARKWQLLMRPLEKLSISTCFKSVFAGCSITMLTPNRVGEFGGRILYVQEHHRLAAISLTILGSMSQLLITMIMGVAGLFFMRYSMPGDLLTAFPWLVGEVLLTASVICTAVLLLIYFRVSWLVSMMKRIRILKRFVNYIDSTDVLSGKQLLRILFLSFLRYLVFILQYLLILKVMQVNISFVLCFWILSVFYLVLAVAPTFGFIELPVRAAASVELLGLYSANILGIQAAALSIWLINLVVPAVIGSILIFGIKILKDK